MRNLRKLWAFVLVLVLMASSAFPAAAQAAEKSTQEKAVVLGNLKIISGVNGEYYLDNQLRRSEAATFIVRMVGKGEHVNRNKSLYSSTPYSDVPSGEWYAPFIGYCYQNGLVLENSGQFRPLDFITEKEFLALVLMALDYRLGIDFTLDTAFDQARDAGLISLSEYIASVSSNPTVTRGRAVEIMYKALTTECRDKDKILLQKMIDEGVVTRLEAMAMGLIVDTVITDIVSVESLDFNKIRVIVNEPVASVGGVLIYSDASDDIKCSVDGIEDDVVIVKTDPLKEGKDYIIELHDVKDRQGNLTNRLMKQFKGFEVQEVTSSFFRISRIEPVNQRSIKVYFTHPLSLNSEVCLYYTITRDYNVIADGRQGRIKAGVLNSDDHGVLLTLDSDLLRDGEVYTLEVDGNMMSAYGARLNDGAGDSMKFVARENTDSKFDLLEIAAVDKNTLLLSFSREINPFLARQVFNFYLTDSNERPIKINRTTVDVSGRALYISLDGDLDKNKNYFLTINNLNDITKQEYITEKVYTFKADYGTATKFKLNKAVALDSQTIELTFNKPLDAETAANADNYVITRYGSSSGVRPARAYFNPADRYRVKLYLSYADRLQKQSDYTVRIEAGTVRDYLGNGIEATREQFAGTDRSREAVKIEEAVPISTDAVKLTLSQEIIFSAGNLMPSNYTLEYSQNFISIKKVPYSVIYADARTIILKFDSLDFNTAYTLKVAELTDYSGNLVKGLEKEFRLEADK